MLVVSHPLWMQHIQKEADSTYGYRGMLLLQGKFSSLPRYTVPFYDAINGDHNIAEGVARELDSISRMFLAHAAAHADTFRVDVDRISPFMLHILYHSSIIFSDIHHRTISHSTGEAAKAKKDMLAIKHMLAILGERWKAGGKARPKFRNTVRRLC
jgi:hypothetical protein